MGEEETPGKPGHRKIFKCEDLREGRCERSMYLPDVPRRLRGDQEETHTYIHMIMNILALLPLKF